MTNLCVQIISLHVPVAGDQEGSPQSYSEQWSAAHISVKNLDLYDCSSTKNAKNVTNSFPTGRGEGKNTCLSREKQPRKVMENMFCYLFRSTF